MKGVESNRSSECPLSTHRGTWPIRNSLLLGTYSSICLGPYGGPRGRELFLMREVPLYRLPRKPLHPRQQLSSPRSHRRTPRPTPAHLHPTPEAPYPGGCHAPRLGRFPHFPCSPPHPAHRGRRVRREKGGGVDASAVKAPLRGGLVFKAHRLVYHSTLNLRVINKKKKQPCEAAQIRPGI